jgi:hypothetical protein
MSADKTTRALRSARRILAELRKLYLENFTLPPHRDYNQMDDDERHGVQRLDQVLSKIDAALPPRKPIRRRKI